MKAGSFCSSLITLIIFCCCSTTQPAPHLDNVHVVFGEVVSGQEVVAHIEGLPVDRMSRPLQDAKVVNCGELVLKIKSKAKKRPKKHSSSSESSTDTDSTTEKTKKKKKHKKNKKRSKSEEGEVHDSNDEEVGKPHHPLVSITKIDPNEIPEVPANKFLYRAGPTNNANQKEFRQNYTRDRNHRTHRKSGRLFKGRGTFRYRTPSRSRSKSVTPPHWKQAQNRTIKLHEFQQLEKERMKKEEDLKKRETDRKRRFVENPDEQEDASPGKLNSTVSYMSQVTENKENDQTDEKDNSKKEKREENSNINAESNTMEFEGDKKRKENPKKGDMNRFDSKFSRRDSSRDRSKRRSRSRERYRSKERDFDRRGSRERRTRRFSPRRRDSFRSFRGGRDQFRYYDRRNDYRRNVNQYHDDNSRFNRGRPRRFEGGANNSSAARFKRRSRSSSLSSKHSKD
ncbi:peptidyl-prolyl cis-trans isomerase G isoform X2 [Prorops nasuta]|uniref:peptidyl-prolyl cis-trans isomerase G isoform X2 n=1 Tax=Prorops nasuta TaxID=863751 RepID=UPI0034CD2514